MANSRPIVKALDMRIKSTHNSFVVATTSIKEAHRRGVPYREIGRCGGSGSATSTGFLLPQPAVYGNDLGCWSIRTRNTRAMGFGVIESPVRCGSKGCKRIRRAAPLDRPLRSSDAAAPECIEVVTQNRVGFSLPLNCSPECS